MIQLQGFDKVEKMLLELEPKVMAKVAREALKEAAKPIKLQAEATAPQESGATKRAIGIANGRKKTGQITVVVGVHKRKFRAKTKSGQSKDFYPPFVVRGHFTGRRLTKLLKDGKYTYYGQGAREQYKQDSVKAGRRFIAGVPFIDKAFEAKKGEALQILQRELPKGIEREAKQLAK